MRRALYAKLGLVAVCWGGAFIAGRELATNLPHFFVAALRYLMVCGVLLPLVIHREGRLPPLNARQWMGVGALGATGVFGYNFFFFAALEQLAAGRVALITTTNASVTALAAWLLIGVRLRWWQVVGVAAALFGAWIVLTRGAIGMALGSAIGAGELYALGGLLVWTVYTLIGRRLMAGSGALSPLGATTYAALIGGALLALAATFEQPRGDPLALSAVQWVAIAYMAIPGTAIAFVWFYEGVLSLGAAQASVFINLVPVCAVVLAGIVLGEPILVSMIVGGLITIAGVSLTNWERSSS
jgi:drug/metabolite transporter (DMT)-like permease